MHHNGHFFVVGLRKPLCGRAFLRLRRSRGQANNTCRGKEHRARVVPLIAGIIISVAELIASKVARYRKLHKTFAEPGIAA